MTYRYRIVDVFTQHPLEGNPLAVFPDAAGMSDAMMQKVAQEMNLSETVFVVPKTREDCAAAVRIFTPTKEMRFAGHPTVGVCWVMLEEGIVPDTARFMLEEKVGPVPIRVESGERRMIWLSTPPIEFGRTYDPKVAARALGLDEADLLPVVPQMASAGNPIIFVALKSKEAIDRAWLDSSGVPLLRGNDPILDCVFVFAPVPDGAYSRMFAPEYGIVEDPATGSATGPLAAYMMRHGLVSSQDGTRFVSEQGTKMGRRSLLHVAIHGDGGSEGIEVGGYVSPLAEGRMTLG